MGNVADNMTISGVVDNGKTANLTATYRPSANVALHLTN